MVSLQRLYLGDDDTATTGVLRLGDLRAYLARTADPSARIPYSPQRSSPAGRRPCESAAAVERPSRSTIRLRSSTEANSTVSLPLRWPSAMLTRVSKRSDSRAARSSSCGCRLPARGRRGLATSSGPPTGDDLLDVADAEPLGDDPLGDPLHRGTVRQAQQGARVAGRQHPGGDPAGDQRRELEQPQRVGDLRPRAADPGGQLVVRAAEVVEQLLVCGGLLERVQLAAVQVLQEGVAQEVVVVGLLDDGRHRGLAGLLAGPPAGARP